MTIKLPHSMLVIGLGMAFVASPISIDGARAGSRVKVCSPDRQYTQSVSSVGRGKYVLNMSSPSGNRSIPFLPSSYPWTVSNENVTFVVTQKGVKFGSAPPGWKVCGQ